MLVWLLAGRSWVVLGFSTFLHPTRDFHQIMLHDCPLSPNVTQAKTPGCGSHTSPSSKVTSLPDAGGGGLQWLHSPSPAVSVTEATIGELESPTSPKPQRPAPSQCHLLLVPPSRRYDRPALRVRFPIGQSTRPSYATSPGSGERGLGGGFWNYREL